MEYVCRHVLGSVSQHTGDKTPTVPIIQAYEKVHGEVLQKLKDKKIPQEKLNELDCVVSITTSSGNETITNFPGGKSKKRRSNKRKSKKNLQK